MPKHGRKFTEAAAKVEAGKHYTVDEAVKVAQEAKFTKFDESLDIAFVLGVDPRHADQMVRGTVLLPHGTGKTKRVLVVASGEKIKEAEDAGADEVGGADAVKKIQDGWMEFDAVVATPDMMKDVGAQGKTAAVFMNSGGDGLTDSVAKGFMSGLPAAPGFAQSMGR